LSTYMSHDQNGGTGAGAVLQIAVLLLAACGGPCGSRAPAPAVAPPSKGVAVTKRTISIDEVAALTWKSGADATFADTTIAEREAFSRILPALLQGKPDAPALAAAAAQAGFHLEDWTVEGVRVWALIEDPAQRRGAGAYLVRAGVPATGREILLQAPHADYDLGTGEIAARLFVQPGGPRALFLNSIHRYQSAPGEREKRLGSPADVAHNPDHLFAWATNLFATAFPRVLVVQLHGFAGQTSEEEEDALIPAGTSIVVSAGNKTASTRLSTLVADGLRGVFGEGVRRFPEESGALGATTNVQGRTVRRRGNADFLHLELSQTARRALRADPEKLAAFGRVLFTTVP